MYLTKLHDHTWNSLSYRTRDVGQHISYMVGGCVKQIARTVNSSAPNMSHHTGSKHSVYLSLQEMFVQVAQPLSTKDWNARYDTLLEMRCLPTLSDKRRYVKLCF